MTSADNADKAGTILEVSDATFAATIRSRNKPVLVEFWATWCPRCKMAAPVIEAIATEQADRLTVAKLDVDANPDTTREFQIVATPTLILFKDGQPVRRIVGAKAKVAYLRELSEVVPDLV
jgi:thioredoxin 1